MRHLPTIALLGLLLTVVSCDKKPPPKPKEVMVTLKARPIGVGTSFRAKLSASSVIGRFPSKELAKRIGQYRAIDTYTTVETNFYAELVALEPEKWRIDFETFERSTKREGGEEAVSTYDLPDKAFFVEFGPEQTTVKDEDGADATESQTEISTSVANVLRERHTWAKFGSSRDFGQGKIVEAPDDLVLGRFVESVFGPVSDPHSTVSFFRFGEDAAKTEVAYFEVNSRFKATEPEMKDGSYLDFEARGKAILRVVDAMLVGYEVDAKVTPRAKTGAMLPEGSGKWHVSFEIDAQTLQVP